SHHTLFNIVLCLVSFPVPFYRDGFVLRLFSSGHGSPVLIVSGYNVAHYSIKDLPASVTQLLLTPIFPLGDAAICVEPVNRIAHPCEKRRDYRKTCFCRETCTEDVNIV